METVDTINAKVVANTISLEEAEQMLKELHPRTDFVYCHDTLSYKKKAYCKFSEPSQRWFYSHWNFSEVVSKNGEFECHSSDLPGLAFYCQLNDTYYKCSDFTEIKCEGDTVCLEKSIDRMELEDGLYYHKVVISDDDLDEEGRASYHSARRLSSRYKGIGVELELECHENIYDFCDKARGFGIFAEEDGSLDCEYGVELIGPIAPFEDYVKWKHWGRMFDIFPKHKCIGHDAGDGYGIHISLSLSLFSDLDLSKFVLFMNTCSKLCKVVAQRDTIYEGDYGAQRKHRVFKKTLTDKYQAVKVDNVRAEVRIFRSTVRKDRFLKNIEFCEAVRQAVKYMSAGTVLRQQEATDAFLKYVTIERKTYPNLFEFLVQKKMIIDNRNKNKKDEKSTINSAAD